MQGVMDETHNFREHIMEHARKAGEIPALHVLVAILLFPVILHFSVLLFLFAVGYLVSL